VRVENRDHRALGYVSSTFILDPWTPEGAERKPPPSYSKLGSA
jgi:hypothetical protein